MRNLIILLALASCAVPPEAPKVSPPKPKIVGKVIRLWSTVYYSPVFKSKAFGIPVRNMRGKIIGRLSKNDFCSLAMEGSGAIDGNLFNYAGVGRSKDTTCKHRPSSYVRFHVENKHKYGAGNRNNPLIPFYSVACDQKKFKFGQKFFIPKAKGVKLPNGKTHDGMFRCDDVGGLIKGNHIDTFIGFAKNWRKENPFDYIKSSPKKTFKAYLVK